MTDNYNPNRSGSNLGSNPSQYGGGSQGQTGKNPSDPSSQKDRDKQGKTGSGMPGDTKKSSGGNG